MQISQRALERAKLHELWYLITKPGGFVLSGYLNELQKSYGLRGVDARVRSRVDSFQQICALRWHLTRFQEELMEERAGIALAGGCPMWATFKSAVW